MKHAIYTFLVCVFMFSTLHSQVLDSSFGTYGKTVSGTYNESEEVSSAVLQPDGKILVGGYDYDENFYSPEIDILRVNGDGTIDSSFATNGGLRFNGSPYGGQEFGGYLGLQPDGKIIGLGSDFDRDDIKKERVLVFRLKTNGTFDSSFGNNGKIFINFGGFYAIARALLVKPDGKIVITGQFNARFAGPQRIDIAQLLPDGNADHSFGVNGVAASGLKAGETGVALALLPGDKILAGYVYQTGGEYKTCLVKYNANGTVDSSFGINGVAVNNAVPADYDSKIALAIQANGKIVEYATTTSTISNPSNIIYKYNANGSLDNTFGTNGVVTAPYNVYTSLSVLIDNAQRILINNGLFAAMRYLPNGKLDSTFGVNGTLTTDFTDLLPGSYARSEQMILQPDSKLVITGYVYYGGNEQFGLARFKNVSTLKAKSTNNLIIALYPNPATSTLNIKGLNAGSKYSLSIVDLQGNIKAVKQVENLGMYSWNIQNLQSGSYYLNVISGSSISTRQFFKQ